jgi:nucleotidyltransferase substrate binding protein (TIGR01987 family)
VTAKHAKTNLWENDAPETETAESISLKGGFRYITSVSDALKNKDVRWRQRFQNFNKAFAQLSSAATLAGQRTLSDLEKQGLIQAFEFTHELAWNTLKDFLEEQGTLNLYGSKDATRQAFATGLIEEGEIWMAMIQSRNRTTHTYDPATAREIENAITTQYMGEFLKFQKRFLELEGSER